MVQAVLDVFPSCGRSVRLPQLPMSFAFATSTVCLWLYYPQSHHTSHWKPCLVSFYVQLSHARSLDQVVVLYPFNAADLSIIPWSNDELIAELEHKSRTHRETLLETSWWD